MRLLPGTAQAPRRRPGSFDGTGSPEQDQAEAKTRLAAAVAELARHVATTQADERIDAELIEQQQQADEARRRAEEAAAAEQRRRSAGAVEAARAGGDRKPLRFVWRAAVVAALFVPIGLDVRAPSTARDRLADVADEAVVGAAMELSTSPSAEAVARQIAQGVADLEGVVLEDFSIDGSIVRVTVSDEADSIVLGRVVPGWFEVEATASATALIDGPRS